MRSAHLAGQHGGSGSSWRPDPAPGPPSAWVGPSPRWLADCEVHTELEHKGQQGRGVWGVGGRVTRGVGRGVQAGQTGKCGREEASGGGGESQERTSSKERRW